MGVSDQAEPAHETHSEAVPPTETWACSTLRDSQEVLDIFNVSAGSFCVG